MYQMSPDMPHELYAELLQSREEDRAARRAARTYRSTKPTAERRTAWRAFGQRVRRARALAQLARG
jgi:hypothetical protein